MFCLIYLASKDTLHADHYAMLHYPVLNGGIHRAALPMPEPELTIAALHNHNWKIGLYPKSDPVMQSFSSWMTEFMPGFDVEAALGKSVGNVSALRKLNVPKFEDVVMWFEDEDDLDEYVRRSDYSNLPLIVSALTIASTNKEKHQWEVVVRANATTVPTTYMDTSITTRGYPENRMTNYVEMYSTLQPTQIVQTYKDGCKQEDFNQWACSSFFLEDTSAADPNRYINNYWLPSFVMIQTWADKFITASTKGGTEPNAERICPAFDGTYRFTDCILDTFFGMFLSFRRRSRRTFQSDRSLIHTLTYNTNAFARSRSS